MTGEHEAAGDGASGHETGHGEAATAPVGVDDSDVGAGAATGVWVTGLLSVVLVLVAIFGLG